MDKEDTPRLLEENMFKKIDFKSLNYADLERLDAHDLKRDEMTSFYQTFDFLDLIKKWPEIVGPRYRDKTSPLKLKNDTLFIIVVHPSIAQEISFLAEDMKNLIFKEIPKLRPILKKLAFQTHAEFFQERQREAEKAGQLIQKLHPQSPRYKLLKAQADKLFGDIEDSEFKEKMISLFIQSN